MPEADKILTCAFFSESDPAYHVHKDIEILYLLEGTGCLMLEEEEHYLLEDALILINSGCRHRLLLQKSALAAGIRISFERTASLLHRKHPVFISELDADKQIRSLIRQLIDRSADPAEETDVLRTGLSYQLIYQLSQHQPEAEAGHLIGTEQKERKEKLALYLEEHFREPVSLNDLAEEIHVSPGYLSKSFRKEFGCGYQEYLNRIRLEHCAEELCSSDKTMLENALTNGFQSLSSFNKAFREHYGVSPTEYRKKQKETKKEEESIVQTADPERVRQYLESAAELMRKPEASVIRITADTTVKRELNRNWNQVLNVGPIDLILRSDLQNQILMLKDALGFRYVRVWNVFQCLMRDSKTGAPEFNYGQFDRALDFLLKNGIKPYLDVEFKPLQVHLTAERFFDTDPSEHAKALSGQFGTQIRKLFNHLANRYGAKELESWYFEFGKSESRIQETSFRSYMQEYCEVYETGYRTLKGMSENIRIGGWGFYGSVFRDRAEYIMRFWNENHCRPDALTVLLFPYEISRDEGLNKPTFVQSEDVLRDDITNLRSVFAELGFADVPIHVTEWSSTISQRSVLNDSCFKAAYIVKNLIDSFGDVEISSYWALSDLYGEYYDTKGILHGGCGLVSIDGIYKPAFYGLEFMNRLQNFVLKRGGNSIVTTNGKGHITILSHNLKKYSYRFYHYHEDEHESEEGLFENQEPQKMIFTIRNVQNGEYRLKLRSLNRDSGSVRDEWIRLGGGAVTAHEVEYLKAVCQPKMRIRIEKVRNGELHLETELQANEIQLIDITYHYEE